MAYVYNVKLNWMVNAYIGTKLLCVVALFHAQLGNIFVKVILKRCTDCTKDNPTI